MTLTSSSMSTFSSFPMEPNSSITALTVDSACPATPSQRLAPPPRGRRPRRVLYPASRCRRAPPRTEAPDPARRWLLVLSVLVFLQIYSEETQSCTELQKQGPEPAACQAQEGEESLGTAQGWSRDEPWRIQLVGGTSDTQTECVVS